MFAPEYNYKLYFGDFYFLVPNLNDGRSQVEEAICRPVCLLDALQNYTFNWFFKWANPGLFSFIFVFPNTHYNFLHQTGMWKSVHRVYCAGIRTDDLWNKSLLP